MSWLSPSSADYGFVCDWCRSVRAGLHASDFLKGDHFWDLDYGSPQCRHLCEDCRGIHTAKIESDYRV